MTRKNMGGVAIDMDPRVLDRNGRAVPGLYAAGEITGSVGTNGSHGMDGTFLGPAILTGRLAGRAIVQAVGARGRPEADPPPAPAAPGPPLATTAEQLRPLLATPRDGYWHFEMAHAIVLEREYACTRCHSPERPFNLPATRQERLAQTETCTNCHDR